MYALFERGNTDFFSKKNIKIFSGIDALAVSMPEKFLRSFFQKATVFSFNFRCK